MMSPILNVIFYPVLPRSADSKHYFASWCCVKASTLIAVSDRVIVPTRAQGRAQAAHRKSTEGVQVSLSKCLVSGAQRHTAEKCGNENSMACSVLQKILQTRARIFPGTFVRLRVSAETRPMSFSFPTNRVPTKLPRPMLEQAMSKITLVMSSRPRELAEAISAAGSSGEGRGDGVATGSTDATAGGRREGERRLDSLDEYDGIITVGGDGTLHEVFVPVRHRRNCGSRVVFGLHLAGRAGFIRINVVQPELINFNTCRECAEKRNA